MIPLSSGFEKVKEENDRYAASVFCKLLVWLKQKIVLLECVNVSDGF